ncbi:MAG: hypothetical protein AAF727_06405 [Pseudomonadota bacterium]
MPKTDPELQKMLKQAASAPRNFTMAIKGKDVALFMSKKTIQPPMVKEIKARVGASKTYEGVCQKGDDGMTFKCLEAIPDQAAVPLKSFVKEQTSLTIKPVFQKVDSLTAVDEDGPDFSDVEGGKPDIDVEARKKAELDKQVGDLRNFLATYDTEEGKLKGKLEAVKTQRATLKKATKDAVAAKKAEAAKGTTDLAAFDQRIEDARKLEDEIFDKFRTAGEDVKKIKKLQQQYQDDLKAYDAAAGFQAKYDLMQSGRQKAIKSVADKMEEVFARTERSLVILGRTVDTFEGDTSWLATHPGQEERVLHEDDWSMAVNDAFMKAGLDQKADFAMLTKFKDTVLKKVKTLLMNPGAKSKDELKAELRAFIKAEGDPALFTGGRHNDGFAVSMIELEQLIDDGYVMMEHDPDGSKDESDKGKPWTGKEQVMVPSGTGQKIKGELGRKHLSKVVREVLGNPDNKTIIAKSADAKAALGRFKAAFDKEEFAKAEEELETLQKELSKAV